MGLVLIILLAEALLLAGLAGLACVHRARLRGGGAQDPLARSLAATQRALRSRGAPPGDDPAETDALGLRIQMLELEQRLADRGLRGDDYWASVCAGYGALAAGITAGPGDGAAQPAHRPEADCEEEARELAQLLEAQQETLDRLSAALAGLIEEPEAHWRQEAEIQSLREGTRKLREGLEILTDESRFLSQRLDQLEGASGAPTLAAAGA